MKISKLKFTAVDDGIVRPGQLPQVVGFSHHTARRTPGFPEPLQLGARSIGWRLKDLNSWLDARPTGYLSIAGASPNLARRANVAKSS